MDGYRSSAGTAAVSRASEYTVYISPFRENDSEQLVIGRRCRHCQSSGRRRLLSCSSRPCFFANTETPYHHFCSHLRRKDRQQITASAASSISCYYTVCIALTVKTAIITMAPDGCILYCWRQMYIYIHTFGSCSST